MLTFASSTGYVNNEVHDTPTRKIEDAINRLVIRWAENVGRKRIARVLSEKRAQEEAEQEGVRRERGLRRDALRRELQALQHAERQRVDRLTAEIARWQESQRLRSYALALLERTASRDGGIEPTDKAAQWAAWISSRADQLDPLVEAEPSILGLGFEEYEQRSGGLEATDAPSSEPPAR
jgi:ferritin-like metal-binding protein YciE